MARQNDVRSRFEGCILGLAIGDALGYPTEFMSLAEIHERFGPAGVTRFESSGFQPPGSYTDDTQMTIAVAEALIEAGEKPVVELMPVMARHFAEWSISPENNRAPGVTCMTACNRLIDGVGWRDSGVKESKGCGSAMRAAPIGLYYSQDLNRVVDVAMTQSGITHGHPTALAAAAGAAVAIALLVNETQPIDLLDQVLQLTGHLDADYENKLKQVEVVLPLPPNEAMEILGEAWVGEEAVADALYCFLRSPDSFEQTVLTGANSEGDSDSIACIAGSMSGAFNGIEGISVGWRNDVENTEYLTELSRRLSKAGATGQIQ